MQVGLALKDPPLGDVPRLARQAESQGLAYLLFPELSIVGGPVTGRDPFVASAAALSTTSRLRVGPGVVGTVFRPARHMALAAASAQELSQGRFVLGCGVSHQAYADQLGVPYPSSPLAHARAYVDELRRLSRAELAFGRGFPLWLAALGDRMMAVAAEHADGVLLNWVTPAWVRRARERIDQQAPTRPTLGVFLRVDEPDALVAQADRYATIFPNYARHFRNQGLSDPADVAAGTCAPLTDRLWGRVAEYERAGADAVLLYPADAGPAGIEKLLAKER
ncbi:MAG: LLM class flavin-dependent oxidoreductase [Streptosporangiaceae bacterium]